MSSNLPCFLIESEQGGSSKNRPSDIVAANTIENHFKQQGIPITFSLVGHTSNKLKLGVNNKESYATLMSTDKWPTQVNNVNITVIEPKFMPDAFALVVRYVPLQYDDDYVREEIERNLESVENVRRIQYRFQRRTNNFRFIGKDLREYNSMLKLGRISIENTFCIVTPFLAGNRMIFCTRCWCLGHMREKCNLEYPRCRICLDSLITGKIHNCSNTARCAQCNGNHHLLCSECQKVMEYLSDLKEQVNNAIAAGKLHRAILQDCVQPKQSQMKQSKFPPLSSRMSQTAPWKQTSERPLIANNVNTSDDTTKILLAVNQNILDTKENTHYIDEKSDHINDKVNQTTLDVELYQETLMKVLSALASLTNEFIWPIILSDVAGLRNRQQQLQKLYTSLNTALNYLKTDLQLDENAVYLHFQISLHRN